MMIASFTKKEREALLQTHRQAVQLYNGAMDQCGKRQPWSKEEAESLTEAEHHLSAAQRSEAEYFKKLPRMTMSCCPFDDKPLVRSFDPYGLDGLWWRPDASPEEVPSCPHFCVLLGAVNFAGYAPLAGDFEVYPGPQVPYLVPRLLEHPNMIAVLSEVKMETGYVAYAISYYAERRPPPQNLTAGWARTNYVYRTQLGEGGWRVPNDSWDFDLRRWRDTGQIRWCLPNSDNSVLNTEASVQCPYVDLPGERQRMVVRGDKAWTAGLPNGKPVLPIDW